MDSSLTSSAHLTQARGAIFSLPVVGFLLILIALVAVFRLSVFHNVYEIHPERIISPDTVRYEKPAIKLLTAGTMRDGLPINESQDLHVAPAYPLFIYGVYKVFGNDHKNLVHAQIALSVLNIVLLYMCAASFWNRKAAAVAAVIFTFAPLQSLYSSILLSETLFVFSVLLFCNVAVRFLQRYATSTNWSLALLLGFALGFSALVRPISYYLVFVFLIALLIFTLTAKSANFSRFLISTVCIVVGFAVLVGPWQIRNQSISGEYLFTDNPGKIMLYWKAAGLIAHQDNIPLSDVREQLKTKVPTDFASIADKHEYEKQAGLDIIKADIIGYIRFSVYGLKSVLFGPGLKKLGNYFDGQNAGRAILSSETDSTSYLESKTGYEAWYLLMIVYSVIYLLFVYVLFIAGAVTYWRRGENRIVVVFCVALAAYFVLASTGHSAADSRMRIPAMPLLILFAGIGLPVFFKSKKNTNRVISNSNSNSQSG